MKIAIGADHGGFVLKRSLIDFLKKSGHRVKDFGSFNPKRCDYPPIGYKVARAVSSGNCKRGILICKSGIGMYMTANKVSGVRAALLHNRASASSSREHNDANVAVLAGDLTGAGKAKKLLKIWLAAKFSGGRHARRVRQMKKIEGR